MTADIAPVDRFLDAVVQRDFVACSRCLADGVVFKALLPDAHHDVSNAREAAWLLTHWFDDAREVEVLERARAVEVKNATLQPGHLSQERRIDHVAGNGR